MQLPASPPTFPRPLRGWGPQRGEFRPHPSPWSPPTGRASSESLGGQRRSRRGYLATRGTVDTWSGCPGKLDVRALQGEMRGTEGSRCPPGRPQTPGPPARTPQRGGAGARGAGVLSAPAGLTSSRRAGGAGQVSLCVCVASASQRNSAREHVFQEFPHALEGVRVPPNRLLIGGPHTASAQVTDSPAGEGLAEEGGRAPEGHCQQSCPGHPPAGRGQTRALAPVLTQRGLPRLCPRSSSPFVPQPVSLSTA